MGKTLEELQREIAKIKKENAIKEQKLRSFKQSKREIENIGRERKKLEQELKSLKNPKSVAFKRNLAKGLRSAGRELSKSGKTMFRFLEKVDKGARALDKPQRRKPIKKKPTRKKPIKRKPTRRRSPTHRRTMR